MEDSKQLRSQISSSATIDLVIRFAFLGLLAYWSVRIILPFITVALWSAILAVALFPCFAWFTKFLSTRIAAVVVTLLSLVIVVGPVTWLSFGMARGLSSLVMRINSGEITIPLPPESVQAWPLVGASVYRMWTLAANNMQAAMVEILPMLKPVGSQLLDMTQRAVWGLLELLAAIVIAGVVLPRGQQAVSALGRVLGRMLSLRGQVLVQLAGSTVRNVSRGIIGIALLQALLAGAGFVFAGIPAASVLAFASFVLSILQIGPTIIFIPVIAWSWAMFEWSHALLFTIFMVPVGLIDNILRPLLLARGLTTPMPVIMVGVIGGAIAYGFVGLFFGPIVLSVVWAVLLAWEKDDAIEGAADAETSSGFAELEK